MPANENTAKAPRGKTAPSPTRLSEPFWRAAAEGRLLLQRTATGLHQFFPRPLSLAGQGEPEWVEASGTGRLIAFTECHVAAPGFEGELPYIMGIVRLDESPRVLAQVVGAKLEQLSVGLPMQVRWLPRPEGPPMYAFEIAGQTGTARP
jgi:uncharacterized OB-fold protein